MAENVPTWNPNCPITSGNHPPQWAPLRDHQRLACDFALDHPRCGLFLPIGTGKSLTTLETLYELNPSCHVLIVGPKPVMRSTWIDEIEKWGYPFRTKSLTTGPRGGTLTKTKRLKRYEEIFHDPPTVYFINRDLIVDLVDNMPVRNGRIIWPFPYVVLDEAQAFKNYSSQRFKAIKKVSPAISRLIELTGTPSPNGLMDLWSLIYLIDGGMRLGRTITEYRNRYFNAHLLPSSRVFVYTLKRGMAPVIHDRIKDVVISVEGIESKLPPVTYDDRIVTLSDVELSVYQQLEQDLMLEFIDGDTTFCANRAVLRGRLAQIASGTIYVNQTNDYKIVHERKLEETLSIVESAGSPVLVAYRFKADRAELMRYLGDNGIDVRVFDGSRKMVADWNQGCIQVMLVQPASAGAGLNLQDGGLTLVWYSIPENLEYYQQTNGRLYRTGQKHPVFIHHLLANVAVERRIMQAIVNKQSTEDALLDAVRVTHPDLVDPMLDAIANNSNEKGGQDEHV